MNKNVIYLRIVHGLFAVYFISCVFYLYYVVFTLKINWVFWLAIISLAMEGLLVFVVNNGDCPLAPLQKKLKDPVPFFNLFLPKHIAKRAIPFFTGLTFGAVILLAFRIIFK